MMENEHPAFETLSKEDQNGCFCHRFTLAGMVSGALMKRHPGIRVTTVHLDQKDFYDQGEPDVYLPRVRRLG